MEKANFWENLEVFEDLCMDLEQQMLDEEVLNCE